jgi:uncharacterized protein YndB with AHSA1/START domain
MNDVSFQRIKPATIRKEIEVKAPRERAFRVFAEHMGDWWFDKGINNGVPLKEVVIEPRQGGRWYEIGEDGSECDWGRVIEWNEPSRLLLAWQINAEWRFDPEFETIVEVRFEECDGGTNVVFEHRALEAFGEAMAHQIEQMDGGWGQLLARYAEEASK